MTVYLILSKCIGCLLYDNHGVMFEDNEHTKLLCAPSDLRSYTIPNTVTQIMGGSEVESAFFRCRDKLTQIFFQEGSKLENLGKFSFYNCSITGTIDLGVCVNLKTLSECAFSLCKNVFLVILPPNLEKICSGCFRECYGIKEITFPKSLKLIEGYSKDYFSTFSLCKSLKKVIFEIDSSISYIGTDCFASCNLSTFSIPKSLTQIWGSSLIGNPLETITVDPENPNFASDGKILTNIAKTNIIYFSGYGQTNYTVPEGISHLGDSSFRQSQISHITLPKSLRVISNFCFLNSKLIDIIIPSSVSEVSFRSFESCYSLKHVVWNATTKFIAEKMFFNCISLKNFTVPSNVVTLGQSAFSGCTSIEYIFIPKTVNNIFSGCFYGINRSAHIIFEEGSNFTYENGILFSFDKKELINCFFNDIQHISINTEIEYILDHAFQNCKIKSVDFSNANSLKKIKQYSFAENYITSIKLPPLIECIDGWSFYSNKHLETIDFSRCTRLELIGPCAFIGTKISNVLFPESICHIFDKAFFEVKTLEAIAFSGSKLISVGEYCFSQTKLFSIEIPNNSTNISKFAFDGSSLGKLIFCAPTNIRIIKSYWFYNCNELVDVKFSEGIEVLEPSVFELCNKLASISFPASLNEIGVYCFKGCTCLASVIIPDNSRLSNIEALTFENCYSLKAFTIPELNEYFTFISGILYNKNCSEIILFTPGNSQKICEIPTSVTKIRPYSFRNVKEIETLKIM